MELELELENMNIVDLTSLSVLQSFHLVKRGGKDNTSSEGYCEG